MMIEHKHGNNGQSPEFETFESRIQWEKITDLSKDSRAIELAIDEQRRGLIGSDPRSLLKRAQEIKGTL